MTSLSCHNPFRLRAKSWDPIFCCGGQHPGRPRFAGIVEKSKEEVGQSAFSIVEQVCKNVKRCHGGDERDRWVGSGLLVAQKQFRRVTGYKQIPAVIREMEALAPSKPEVVKRRKAS